MSNLLSDCVRLFNNSNLYDVLSISKTASSADVKKAYYRLSLTVHPDRVDKSKIREATEKFQVLAKLYSILSDDEKRKIYDDTGSLGDEVFAVEDRDWFDYWRILFPEISEKDIQDFEVKYRGSDEEEADLRRAYVTSQGDMDKIIATMLCATVDDEQRFRDLLGPLVTSGDLPTFDLFVSEPPAKRLARKRKAEKERKEAEAELKKKSKKKEEDSLSAVIQARQQSREKQAEDFFSQLEQKYGGGDSKSKKSKSSDKSEAKKKSKSSR